MRTRGIALLGATILLATGGIGCNRINPNQGFTVSAAEQLVSAGGMIGPSVPLPEIPVSGDWVPNQYQHGSVTSFNEYTDALGSVYISNGRAPAFWNMYATFPYYCGPLNFVSGSGWPNYGYMYESQSVWIPNLADFVFNCEQVQLPGASVRFAIRGSLPSTITLWSQNAFTTSNGMPEMYVYDGTPNLVTTVSASSVDTNGAWATFPFPTSLAQNAYGISVVNQTGGGAIWPASYNFLSVASSQMIAGNPFGVSVAAQTDTYDYQETCDRSDTNGSMYYTFPVVSLYSANQILIGGMPVDVGPNPMAVAAYSAAPVRENYMDECDADRDDYTGTTQAIVTNSGSNTVSIIDIVNDAVLYTITVGNQPVAVAVSSDGSSAYVANYTDSTITLVDLNTDTATTTVAVGGMPTSVTLSSAGTLYVGGAGFLTEINTQTMTVTATQVVSNKTILALGFSDSVNQLVATTADGNGSVYSDQVGPSSITSESPYSPVASNQVSGMSVHPDIAGGQVQSFTATLPMSPTPINVSQVGAPPLVIQDGWAVITATPTGFSVTDITGNDVLISEQTPSPITAIAVDPTLNAAYLTMPDSNVLLIVPLPAGSN